jgi:hypothetical protein
MTDTSPSPASDEDLSASIDGELDDLRSAQLRADPANAARLDQLHDVVRRLGEPVDALRDSTVDRLVATAIDGAEAPPAPSGRLRGPSPWLVAAAIVVLLAVGLTLVWRGRGSDHETTANAAASAEQTAGSASIDDAAKGESGTATTLSPSAGSDHGIDTDVVPTTTIPETLATAAPLDLGTFADGDSLREALATAFPTTPATADLTAGAVPPTDKIARCDAQLQVTLKLDDAATHIGYAEVAGRSVLVYEFAAEDLRNGSATTMVAAVGTDACDQVVIFQR